MHDSSIGEKKARIRREVLAARRALPEAARRTAATRLQAALVELVRGHRTVAAYAPFGTEPGGPDLPDVLARAVGPGELLIPVLREDNDLDWEVHGSGAAGEITRASRTPQRRSGSAAARRPTGRLPTPAAWGLLIVPALAVDRRGIRLGRGGGSYDRFLARVSAGSAVVALLYDGELRDEPLPADPHDRPVTAVLTPAAGLIPLAG